MDSLAVENAALRAALAQVQDERDSLARIAKGSLQTLQRAAVEPVGFWIRQMDEDRAKSLLRVEHVERLPTHVDKWSRMTIQASPPAVEPSFASPVVPIQVAVPTEIFDHIASFVGLSTAASLCRVDFGWLHRLSPFKHDRMLDLVLSPGDRARLVSLLTRGGSCPLRSSGRLEPVLSLRNVQDLSVSSLLIQDDAFTELSLANLRLDGHPLRLELLAIYLTVEIDFPASPSGPTFRPSPQFLSLLDPLNLHVRDPHCHLGPQTQAPRHAFRHTFQITKIGAEAMRRWTRLEMVYLLDLDLHYTIDDIPAEHVPTAHIFFLLRPESDAEEESRQLAVWWLLCRDKTWASMRISLGVAPVLLEPVTYLTGRRALERSRVGWGFIMVPDDEERNKLVEKGGLPARFQIISKHGEEVE